MMLWQKLWPTPTWLSPGWPNWVRPSWLFPRCWHSTVFASIGTRRRVGTKANSNDLYAQQASLPREYLGTPQDQGWKEPLIDNRKSPVPDQAAFRIDFPQWLETLPQRDRDIVLQLCQGDRPVEVARHHGITRGRGSQLRKELHDGWLRFHGEISSSSRD